jgi:ABC transport system ATP-binding/permease protein
MNESTLDSLVHLLTLIARTRPQNSIHIEKNLVITFLQIQFDSEIVEKYSKRFEYYYSLYAATKNQTIDVSEKIVHIAGEISKKLNFRQRIFLIVNLYEFSKYLKDIFDVEQEKENYFGFITQIGNKFNIDKRDINTVRYFLLNDFHLLSNKEQLVTIVNEKRSFIRNIKQIEIEEIKGIIYVVKIHPDFFLVKYIGGEIYYLDKRILKSDTVFFFSIISVLILNDKRSIYFNDLQEGFLSQTEKRKIIYLAKDIDFHYKKSSQGIKRFSFRCESGELIGILGSSGSGKTTLMNLLNGNLSLTNGKILINSSELNSDFIKHGRIGYVPQDDLVVDELSVYNNLYYNTLLCQNWPKPEIQRRIGEILDLLGIFEIRNLKVSSPEKKIISGGQRKRLNIANELIREPDLFFIDEPTSGLSSSDSLKLMHILKHLSLRNKIVFVNIHQPADAVFSLFDRVIILDRGGYPVYTGRPNLGLRYFRNISKVIYPRQGVHRGEQEEILSIIEEPFIDEFGNDTNKRNISPETWYNYFLQNRQFNYDSKGINHPPLKYKRSVPNVTRQFVAYFMRNFLSKVSNRQYRNIALLIAPLLAFILAALCKHFALVGEHYKYIFSENENLPGFYFMGIVAITFIGLMTSAEDIIKDNKMRIRERYLGLNAYSYYLSKVVLLFFISLVQTFLFAGISTLILKLSGNFSILWLTLFLVSFMANVTGLFISALLNSLVAIYILIPIVLIPQILLSGVVVKYENLHPFVLSEEFVPTIGDIMPTRWAYEILMINQFKNNNYQKHIFGIEKQESILTFIAYSQVPKVQSVLSDLYLERNSPSAKGNVEDKTSFIVSEVQKINHKLEEITQIKTHLYPMDYEYYDSINQYLVDLKKETGAYIRQLLVLKDKKISELGLGENEIFKTNFNKSVSEFVRNQKSLKTYLVIHNSIVQLSDPIYIQPYNKAGKTRLFSSQKRIGKNLVSTITFDFIVLFFMIFIGILSIITELPYKIKNLLRSYD